MRVNRAYGSNASTGRTAWFARAVSRTIWIDSTRRWSRRSPGTEAGRRWARCSPAVLKGLETKYLLKRLLQRRLPAYPVGQRKGYGALQFPDLYPNGPLAEVWERYPVPEAFATEPDRSLLDVPSQATWNLIALAVWKQRIQQNPALEAVAGSRRFDWQLDRELAAAT